MDGTCETTVQPTPGPWEISEKSATLVIGHDPRLYPGTERVTIAKVDPGGDRLDMEIGDANARLIASAPELFSALKGLLGTWITNGLCPFGKGQMLACDCNYHAALDAARAALNKAEGRRV